MRGAKISGTRNAGTSWITTIRAEASVLPVSSNTRNDRAKPPAMPPIAPISVAAIKSVKFRFQSFMLLTSSLL